MSEVGGEPHRLARPPQPRQPVQGGAQHGPHLDPGQTRAQADMQSEPDLHRGAGQAPTAGSPIRQTGRVARNAPNRAYGTPAV
ncbi:hypothetical protein JBE27_49070 [Streptomyces albiflaviniger]|nr:hypothetical protein [Streptomyces albiflaviniger]